MYEEPLVILLAEDDEGQANLVRRTLTRSGITNAVVHVSDGRQALDYIFCEGQFAGKQHSNPLLILLDVSMPFVDGIEVLRRVKECKSTAQTPVVMLTTTDDPREVRRCYALGCNIFITKPVGYEAFVESIRHLGLFLQIVKIPGNLDEPLQAAPCVSAAIPANPSLHLA